MLTILLVIIGIAVVCGIGGLLMSSNPDPKERAAEAAGAAAGGAMMGVSCMLQLMFYAVGALIGLWLLTLIFGK